MALEILKSTRWWYARMSVEGKVRRFPLTEFRDGKEQRIEIKGRRPESLRHPEAGDRTFLESYHRARAAHDRLEADLRNGIAIEKQIFRLLDVEEQGGGFKARKVEDLADLWESTLRGEVSKLHRETSRARMMRFCNYMNTSHPNVRLLVRVLPEHVAGFLRGEESAGLSAKTWNEMLRLLKSVFKALEPTSPAYTGFLRDLKPKKARTVHRRPLTDEEISLILRVAEERESVIHGPLVTSAFTGMRRGDACTLKWSGVDLSGGMIRVQTRKTGEPVEIPLHVTLRGLLEGRKRSGEYVWTDAAELYMSDPGKVDARLRAVLAGAGFVDTRKPRGKARPDLPALPPEETLARVLATLHKATMRPDKRERMERVLTAYLVEGKPLREIAQSQGFGKGSVSGWLNEAERLSKVAILRREETPLPARGPRVKDAGDEQRMKRGSQVGWHSLRASFVTACLSAGMAPEVLGRATGHTAIEIARDHYFKPSPEQVRREFAKAIPGLMSEAEGNPVQERMRDTLKAMTARTWKRDRDALLKLMEEKP